MPQQCSEGRRGPFTWSCLRVVDVHLNPLANVLRKAKGKATFSTSLCGCVCGLLHYLLAFPTFEGTLPTNKHLRSPMFIVSGESKVIWKMQELLITCFQFQCIFCQQLMLILGRNTDARASAKCWQICKREAGLPPTHLSPEVKGLSRSEAAALPGYPA